MSVQAPTHTRPRTGPLCLRWDMRVDLPPAQLVLAEEDLAWERRRAAPAPPDPGNWARSLARGIVEVLLGLRPLPQLRRWVVHALYEELEDVLVHHPHLPRAPGPCTALSAHVCHVRDGVVEVSVVVADGRRHRGVALRLERFRDRWIATALDIA